MMFCLDLSLAPVSPFSFFSFLQVGRGGGPHDRRSPRSGPGEHQEENRAIVSTGGSIAEEGTKEKKGLRAVWRKRRGSGRWEKNARSVPAT